MSNFSGTDLPKLYTWKDRLCLFFFGICMGAADIVPGISGGTMAFIMGIYEDLIISIKSLTPYAFKQLFLFRFKTFSKLVSWQFLLCLISGITVSFLSVAQLLHYILNHEIYRVYLYSAFLGLTLASIIFCSKQLTHWRGIDFACLFSGATIAFILTGTVLHTSEPLHSYQVAIFDWWLIACGAIAISAMLLPGISGSYLLTILGAYPIVIAALADLTANLQKGALAVSSLFILGNVLVGIILGGLIFSHVVSWLLRNYHNLTIAALTGFMIGALRSVWPFWTLEYFSDPFQPEKGLHLQIIDPILPDISSPLFWNSILLVIGGFALVFLIEFLSEQYQSNS
jgi:putative membrane protein